MLLVMLFHSFKPFVACGMSMLYICVCGFVYTYIARKETRGFYLTSLSPNPEMSCIKANQFHTLSLSAGY